MKNTDEIKKGLECHARACGCDMGCPYVDMCREDEGCPMSADALAYIQQLETDGNAALMQMIDEACNKISALEVELKCEMNDHQYTIEVAERRKRQIEKLKELVVRLNSELVELIPRVPRWIPVEEKLPEQGAMALCYTRNYIEVLQWDGKSGLWFGIRTINAKGSVTHWMPLPEPPEVTKP